MKFNFLGGGSYDVYVFMILPFSTDPFLVDYTFLISSWR